ncbi:type IV pilus assembly PilZ [Planomonospora sphaerica]|uniref:Type IV pilus assembly PilZ n=1 Tax=Planomonospora sphaerica TaxID=161355 RepID=A0A161LYX1_9ACTN|nr:PilZ domain-containing protein [Planomonospora sphaerica]GAT71129.1 type IV pilus assembly PilZ [Planomonospora sphaerica]
MTSVSLPDVNSLVEIALQDGRVYPTRVEDTDGLILMVAAPRGTGDIDVPEPGEEVFVRWTGPRGLYTAPGTFTASVRDRVALWAIEAEGTVDYFSRRNAVRVAGGEPVRLLDLASGREVFHGRFVDISERGARCQGTSAGLSAEQDVMVKMVLDDNLVALAGNVLTVSEAGGDAVVAVVIYDPPEAQAQIIRRYVMNMQIRARRTAAANAGD